MSSDRSFVSTVRNSAKGITSLNVEVVPCLEDCVTHLDRQDIGIALMHVQSRDDATLLQKIVKDQHDPTQSIPVLAVIEDSLGGQVALELLRVGLMDCLTRPLDKNRLTFLIDSLTLRKRYGWMPGFAIPAKTPRDIAQTNRRSAAADTFLFSSPVMLRLVEQVRKIADRQHTIVITGETGTGKTHLARFIHHNSFRRQGNLVHVDCGAVPENLIEGELFGYRKGAFTGASQDYEGKCAAAAGGTLFLDEIDALSLTMQSRLLRLTDDRVYSPIGVVQERKLDARIIVGTNRNLAEEVAAGRFRQDLYFRLSVFELQVPALRKRPEEIRSLVAHVMNAVAADHGTDVPEIEENVWRALESYHWRGNVRELRNTVERFMAFCSSGIVQLADLSPSILDGLDSDGRSWWCIVPLADLSQSILGQSQREGAAPAGETASGSTMNDRPVDSKSAATPEPSVSDSWIRRIAPQATALGISRARGEVDKIVQILRETENNRTHAAQALGISREALYKKLRKYQLLDFHVN